MIKSFITSFRLKNTYKTNSIIYSLQSIWFVRKLLPDSLYASQGLKIFANIVSVLLELGSVFVGKVLYLLLMVLLELSVMKAGKPDAFAHMFFFLTLAGGLLNSHIFNPGKDKYYAIFLMRMDARSYTLSNYFYFLLKMLVGFLPFTVLFGRMAGLGLAACLLLPVLVCSVKLIFAAVSLYRSRKSGRIINENLPTPVVWTCIGILTAAAYIPPYLGYAVPENIVSMATLAAAAVGVFCLAYVIRFPDYRRVCKELLKPENLAMNTASSKQIVEQAYRKKIQVDTSQTSKQTGYKYFNELFMKRHSKLLTKSAKKITVGVLVVIVVLTAACFIKSEIKEALNQMILIFLPYFLMIMYFMNRGRAMTQAMFMNCDHSMLTYRFYRQSRAILSLFTQRLKYVTAVNLIPASVIAVGLPFLLYVSGGTKEPMNYVVLMVSILAMSVFFSVHTMVLYYLLQPYNVHMESKNAAYSIVDAVTYFVCYFAIGKKVPILTFGIGVSVFCIIYVAAALILAYRLAPKTFKLRQ